MQRLYLTVVFRKKCLQIRTAGADFLVKYQELDGMSKYTPLDKTSRIVVALYAASP